MPSLIYVIDDDVSFLKSLTRLLRIENFSVESFSSAEEFLKLSSYKHPSCLVSDIQMPGLSGLDLQNVCAQRGIHMPMIFMTGYGEVPMSVRAMKNGAVDFLLKPYSKEELFKSVNHALQKDLDFQRQRSARHKIQHRIDALSEREMEVMEGVIVGKLNKQIAFKLGISEKTVKFHRAHVMLKMKVGSVADLVRIVETVRPTNPSSKQNHFAHT